MTTTSLINSINLFMSIVIMIGAIIWLWRFLVSFITHRDKVGLFLVSWALVLLIQNSFAASLQASQVSGLMDSGMGVLVFMGRTIERVLSIFLLIGMFYLAREKEE